MWRARIFLLSLSLGALGLAGCGLGGCANDRLEETPAPIARGARPFVLVTLDTTRVDRLQPYGATDVATPSLLSLAREGIVFEQAMSVAPITLVAHTSLLTGLYPPRHGVRNNGIHFVSDDLQTLAETLAAADYRTGAFVSAAVLEKRYGLDQGFEIYDDDLSSGTNRQPRVVPDRAATATVDAASAWLDDLADDERFFLWVHFYDPHAVYSPPAPYRDRYRDRPYDGEIAYMDAELGRLLAHPALAQAAVAVIGDHGESLGEHGEQTHAILAYQSTLHVPFLLRIPGGPAGRRVQAPVSQVDLVPTALDLLGLLGPLAANEPAEPALELAGQSDGRSLLPLLESTAGSHATDISGAAAHYAETYLPFYTYGWAKLRVLRHGEWKLIDGPDPELYRLSADAGEQRDLAAQDPSRLAALQEQLDSRLGEDTERAVSLELDDEARERLRSLGYLASATAPKLSGARPDPKAFVDLHVGLERSRALLRERRAVEAERELRRVLSLDASNLAALTELATARELQGDLDGAVTAAEKALSLDPDDSRLFLLMARLEQRRQRPEKALELLDAALELSPRFLEARLEKAALLTRLGRPEATRLVASMLSQEGEHARVLLAQARLPEVDVAAAEPLLRKALERDPFLIPAWRQLGRNLERQGRLQESMAAYRQGLERAPDDADLHALLGRLLARTGGDAEVHLREALRLSSARSSSTRGPIVRPEVAVSLGAHIAEKGRLKEAIELYDLVLEADPEHLGARNNRAVALYRSGHVDEALLALEDLAREHVGHADAHNNLAALSLDRGRWSEASKHAQRALKADTRHANAWLNLGLARDGLNRPEDAEKAYRRCLELEAEHLMARFHLGRLLAGDAMRLDESIELLRHVSAQIPSFAEPHLLLGELYAEHDPRRARAHLNTFLRLIGNQPSAAAADPRIPQVHKRLAELSLR